MNVVKKEDLIKGGYDCLPRTFAFLEFVTEPMDGKDAMRCVHAIGSYNDFYPKQVCEAIKKLMVLDPAILFVVGRESSPVLYVHKSALSDLELMGVLHQARPDEMHSTKELHETYRAIGVVRAWWD